MLKLAVLLIIAIVIFRWAFGFWPWHLAKGPETRKAANELASARRVLGVAPGADRTEILAAYRLAMTRAHPDRGGSTTRVHEVDAARETLLRATGEPGGTGGAEQSTPDDRPAGLSDAGDAPPGDPTDQGRDSDATNDAADDESGSGRDGDNR